MNLPGLPGAVARARRNLTRRRRSKREEASLIGSNGPSVAGINCGGIGSLTEQRIAEKFPAGEAVQKAISISGTG